MLYCKCQLLIKKVEGIKIMKKQAQSLIEYGLILAMVAVISIVILGKFGNTLTTAATNTDKSVSDATANATASYCTSIGKTLTNGTCQ